MPTVRIFGQEVERKTLFIGGGLVAAAVAVVVFIRARAASQANAAEAAQAAQPQDQGGMSIAAPTGQVADQYQQQIDNAQLQAETIANQYQSNLVAQQQKQFDFQYAMQEQLAPDILANEKASLGVSTHFNKAAAKAAISCPGDASVRTDPTTGQLYCRQKTSGGWGPAPVGDLIRTVKGLVYGAEAAAPSIGYQASQAAAQYYMGQYLPPKTVSKKSGNPAALPAKEPQTYTPGIAPHSYPEITI